MANMFEKKLYKNTLKKFVLLLPFLSAFALASWMPLPMLFIIISFLWLFLAKKLRLIFLQSDLLLIGVYLLGLVGAFTAAPHIGERTIMHTIAFGATVLFYFFVVRSIALQVNIVPIVGRLFAGMILLLSLYVITEFILSNAFGVDFDSFIPHYRSDITKESGSTIFGIFVRPRGLAEEAGHTSLLYELGLPLSSLYVRKIFWPKRLMFYALAISAFTMLFSVAGIVALVSSLFIVGVFKFRVKYLRSLTFVFLACVVLFLWKPELINPAVTTIQYKAQIVEPSVKNNTSAGVRRMNYRKSLEIAKSAPQGLGWGTVYQIRQDGQSFSGVIPPPSTISLYLEILVATGVLGIILFIWFGIQKVHALFRMKRQEADALLIATISLGMHYVFISNFWFPIPWLALALADAFWVEKYGLPSTSVSLKP